MTIRFEPIKEDPLVLEYLKFMGTANAAISSAFGVGISFDPDEDPGYRFAEKEKRRRRIHEKERRGR